MGLQLLVGLLREHRGEIIREKGKGNPFFSLGECYRVSKHGPGSKCYGQTEMHATWYNLKAASYHIQRA